MRDYLHRFTDWFETPWEVKRGIYSLLWYYLILTLSLKLITTFIN